LIKCRYTESGHCSNGENVATENGRTGALPHIALRGIAIPLLCPKIQMGKKYFFEGAMSEPLVYLNGKKVGEWAYGYSYFYFDVSSFKKEQYFSRQIIQ
jgi:beta-galactosidase